MSYTVQQDLGATINSFTDFGDASIDKYEAGSFTASSAYTLTQVGVGLQKAAGSPLLSALTGYIYADSGGSGPGTLLATSTNTVSSTLTSGNVYYLFQFTGVSLSNATRYWFGMSLASPNASNYPQWNAQTGGSEACYYSSNGTSWSLDTASRQLTMQMYVTSSSVSGTISITLDSIAPAINGGIVATGTITATLDDISATISGAAVTAGTLAATLDDITTSISSTALTPGTIAITLDDLTTTINGTVITSGAVALSLDDTTSLISGGVVGTGTVTAILDDITTAINGIVGSGICGSIAFTLDDVTTTMSGGVQDNGTIGFVLDDISVTVSGSAITSGTASVQLDDIVPALAGLAYTSGQITVPLSDVTFAGTGSIVSTTITATVTIQLDDISFLAQTLKGTVHLKITARQAGIGISGRHANVGISGRTASVAVSGREAGLSVKGRVATVKITPEGE